MRGGRGMGTNFARHDDRESENFGVTNFEDSNLHA